MNKIHWRLCKKTGIVKHLPQNFYIKILSLWPSGLGMVPYKILDQFLSPCQTWINPSKASQNQTLQKLKNKLQYKNSKSVTLTLKSCTGLGIVLHKILDQRLSSYQTWKKYTTGFGNNEVLKTLMQSSKSMTLTLRSCMGVGMVLYKILDQYLSSHQTWTKSIKGFGNNEVLKL